MGRAHGLVTIRLFSKSNTKDEPSSVSKTIIGSNLVNHL